MKEEKLLLQLVPILNYAATPYRILILWTQGSEYPLRWILKAKNPRGFNNPFLGKEIHGTEYLKTLTEQWKECYAAGMFTEFMEQRGPGHTSGDDKIFEKGFLDFKVDIAKAISKLDFYDDDEALDKKNQLEAMDIACDSVII